MSTDHAGQRDLDTRNYAPQDATYTEHRDSRTKCGGRNPSSLQGGGSGGADAGLPGKRHQDARNCSVCAVLSAWGCSRGTQACTLSNPPELCPVWVPHCIQIGTWKVFSKMSTIQACSILKSYFKSEINQEFSRKYSFSGDLITANHYFPFVLVKNNTLWRVDHHVPLIQEACRCSK